MFILLKNIYTMYMVYISRFSYKCRKLFPVSRNLKQYLGTYIYLRTNLSQLIIGAN